MNHKYFLAIDEGTTSVRAVVFNEDLSPVGSCQIELTTYRPDQDCVELDAEEIYQKTVEVCRCAVKQAGIAPACIACCGITTQRSSWVLWDKETGVPAHKMVTWLDTRAKHSLASWKKDPEAMAAGGEDLALARPYTSYVALRHVLDHDAALAERVKKGELIFGTPDSFLLYRLTKEHVHRIAMSNGSHTGAMLLNGEWNHKLLNYFDLPLSLFPEICPESFVYGHMDASVLGVEIPITGVVADQQSALFSQGCLEEGDVKCTNGTGTFVTLNLGHEPKFSTEAFYTRVAWKLGDEVTYMTEGHSATCGVCVEWMRDHMKWFKSHKELEEMEFSVKDNHDVYFVPALQGMGTPYLNYGARGAFFGITGDTDATHMVRAVIEALAYAGANVCKSVQKLHGVKMHQVKLSGGVSKNPLIGQYIANVLGVEVVVPDDMEASLLGAVEFAAMQTGTLTMDTIRSKFHIKKVYTPDDRAEVCKQEFARWLKAVDRVLDWRD